MSLAHSVFKKLGKRKFEELRRLAQDGGDVESALAAILAEKREHKRLYQIAWRKANPEKRAEQAARFRRNNREKIRKWDREYRAANPEKFAAKEAKYKEERKERDRRQNKVWAANNPDKVKARWQREGSKTKARQHLLRNPEAVQKAISTQLPAYLDAAARKDIVADVCTAIMARKIMFDDLPTCARPFVAAHNRMFDRFKTLSLDAPIPGTDLRRVDMLVAPESYPEMRS